MLHLPLVSHIFWSFDLKTHTYSHALRRTEAGPGQNRGRTSYVQNEEVSIIWITDKLFKFRESHTCKKLIMFFSRCPKAADTMMTLINADHVEVLS